MSRKARPRTLKSYREELRSKGIHNDYEMVRATNSLCITPQYRDYMVNRFTSYLITSFVPVNPRASFSSMQGIEVQMPRLRGNTRHEEKACALSDAMKQAGGEWEKSPFDTEAYLRRGTIERALAGTRFTDDERDAKDAVPTGVVEGDPQPATGLPIGRDGDPAPARPGG